MGEMASRSMSDRPYSPDERMLQLLGEVCISLCPFPSPSPTTAALGLTPHLVSCAGYTDSTSSTSHPPLCAQLVEHLHTMFGAACR